MPSGDQQHERLRMTPPVRILIAKPGLDSHDRGAKVIAFALREAGMEVIYTGIRRTPEEIVRAAIAEDVAMIGLSILAGAHMQLTGRVLELLKAEDANDILVVLGGPIPAKDTEQLKQMGVAEVFTPGMNLADIPRRIYQLLNRSPDAAPA